MTTSNPNRTEWLSELKSYVSVIGAGLVSALIATFGCLPRPGYRVRDVSSSGSIFISLDHAVSGQQNQFTFLFAAPSRNYQFGFCTQGNAADCKPGSPNYTSTTMIYDDQTTKFFNASSNTTITEGMTITMVASDTNNNVQDQRSAVFNGT